jgi:hypothetical protein
MCLILRYLFLTWEMWVQQGWAHIRSSFNKLCGIMCMNSSKVWAHMKCKAYQRRWLKLSITFRVGQNFISFYPTEDTCAPPPPWIDHTGLHEALCGTHDTDWWRTAEFTHDDHGGAPTFTPPSAIRRRWLGFGWPWSSQGRLITTGFGL